MPNTAPEQIDIIALLKGGLAKHQGGQLAEACAAYQQVLRLHPGQPDALHLLGMVAVQQGKPAIGEQLIGQAISVHPTFMMYFNLANVLQMQHKHEAAIDAYTKAIALNGQLPEAYNNLGVAYRDVHRLDDALASYLKALDIKPDYAEACNNAGVVMRDKGNMLEATGYYQRAISLKPDYAEAHNNLASTLKTRGMLPAAVDSYQRAIALNPDYADAYNNLGNVYNTQGMLDAAVESFTRALALKPRYADAYSNLGNALQGLGRYDEAVDSYRQALELDSGNLTAHSNLLFSLCFHSRVTPELYVQEARDYGKKVLAKAQPFTQWPSLSSANDPALLRSDNTRLRNDDTPLRVGLVSGDLKMHPVGYFIESIVAHLDKSKVQLVVYNTQPNEDTFSARIKAHCAEWHSLMGLTDAAAAQKIHADGIHILIDLAGHTAFNRLPVFAWRPAPLQITWLGYFNTTGVPGIDCILADPVAVPAQNHWHFTENVVYLPDTRLCFTPPADTLALQLTPLPALKNGHITFGCFQKISKVNDNVLQLWGRIFQALPSARLRLQSKHMNDARARARFLEKLASFGIAPQQVQISAEMPREAYLAAHAEVDMILDTFPFPGGTTTCEALWMGVPTLTLRGNTMLARQGASMLSCVGLPGWIAENADDYVAKALQHATRLPELAALRGALRSQMAQSPLVDAALFARHLEHALYNLWQQRAGQAQPDAQPQPQPQPQR